MSPTPASPGIDGTPTSTVSVDVTYVVTNLSCGTAVAPTPGNVVRFVNIGSNAQVTGVGGLGDFTAFAPSYRSEVFAIIRGNDPAQSVTLRLSANTSAGFEAFNIPPIDLTASGLPNITAGPSGVISIEICESFDDASVNPDAGFNVPFGLGSERGSSSEITLAVAPASVAADLSLTLSASPEPVAPGTNLTYTAVVTNIGPDAANNVGVEIALPSGTSLISATPAGGGTCSTGASLVACSFAGSIPPSGSRSLSAVVLVSPNAPNGSQLIASALTYEIEGGPDPNGGNNEAVVVTTVSGSSAVQISLTASAAMIDPGAAITYSITVSNQGPGNLTQLSIELSQLTNLIIDDYSAAGANCAVLTDFMSCTWPGITAVSTVRNLSISARVPPFAQVGGPVGGRVTISANGLAPRVEFFSGVVSGTPSAPGSLAIDQPDVESEIPGGGVSNGQSRSPALSRNAQNLAFVSDATNLAPEDLNARPDVFVRDRVSGSTVRASAVAELINGGVAEAFDEPSISASGSVVAFSGSSGQIYANVNGIGKRISVNTRGGAANGTSSEPMVNGAGNRVYFDSTSTDLTFSDGNGPTADVYVANISGGAVQVQLLSTGASGEPANGPSSAPWASDDGTTVAFSTLATNIVPGAAPPPQVEQVVVVSGAETSQLKTRISGNVRTGQAGTASSRNVSLTPNGRYGVFESDANNLVDGDTNGVTDVFRFELAGGRVIRMDRMSVTQEGVQGNGPSKTPVISDDGMLVTFATEATNLVTPDTNGSADIVVKSVLTGSVSGKLRTANGEDANGPSTEPTISGNGTVIAFGSSASNLAAGDTNNRPDVFSATLNRGPTDEPQLIQQALPTPNPPNPNCPAGYFTATVEDGPGAGLTSGLFGLSFELDPPGTRSLEGGLNFGGLIDISQVGFAGVNISNPANESQRLNLALLGSPASSSSAALNVRIRVARRTPTSTTTVFEATRSINMAAPYLNSVDVIPGYYEATVEATSGTAGGAPEGQFYFSLTTNFLNRPGGGFQGGAVVGGYHAAHPFGGVSGFAAICLGTQHSGTVRVLSQPTYGAAGARDLRLRLKDSQQRDIVVVPAL